MEIAGYDDLNSISEDSSVELVDSIHIPENVSTDVLESFEGTLDGNNNSIYGLKTPLFETIKKDGVVKNLSIKSPQYSRRFATDQIRIKVFGFVACENKGVIENISISDATLECEEYMKVGAITGVTTNLHNEGSVKSCAVTGSISGGSVVGGVIGRSYYGDIQELYFEGSVEGDVVGGVIGELNHSDIQNSKAEGCVEGTTTVGGFVGAANHSTIERCGSLSNVEALVRGGGFSGELYETSVVDSYSHGSVSAKDQVAGFSPLIGEADTVSIYWDYPSSTLSSQHKTDNCVDMDAESIEMLLSI